jgi:hypothetical protein
MFSELKFCKTVFVFVPIHIKLLNNKKEQNRYLMY